MVRSSQQSITKRKRKSNDLIWARDGLYEHPAYLLENCNEDDDTTKSDKVWVEWSSNGTIACIPKSRISSTDLSSRRRRSNNDDNNDTSSSDGIQQIIVEGCGMPEINGTYARNETSQRGLVHSADDRGASVFSKKGEWKGEEVDFVIYRTSSDWWWQWCISIGYDILLYKTKDNTYAPHMPPPPLHGWEVMGSGVDPAPTIKYKRQIATDNITSSVSSKVKKEETYGGDTDNEDKKIAVAAVPTPVVSSQLKKGKYDEDTDEDIAPDPVESTRVSVKAEAEEDTDKDEGPAPDSMESSQLKKEENDEESTDDEYEDTTALYQVQSCHFVKVKEKKKGRIQTRKV